ncbi:tRNA (guanosine(46)-N7)-methyltransferase TrmB [Xylanimonas oleitrophica]|uniref:tRNA (guanine-N(7)-)-methyltransferase n=1 Tax=Xylanimonas oleitrophica TaxID=2607479 RepID=A0A2W5WW36_9MICO|nr:tRNA (guanosine(46)-N7)-methyltransferase TrmB [Xylanimonas oleitrophica]PZR55527.1 tRNA (guanosine(46)-N7)-methyltransferase TrmB [Xylanimonas oleitrophica]
MPPAAAQPEPMFRTQPVSFVRRSGRLTASQQRAWDERRDAYLVEVPRAVARTSVDPAWRFDAEAVFGRRAPLVVEIGSGQGENVVEAADAHPERDHLAVEVYVPGLAQTIVRAGQRRDRQGLANLRLVQANAAELLATSLPESSIDELWVFFPDPWHKARHHKRRLVTPRFAELAARVLRPGGTWRLATDWAEYGEQMLEVAEASPAFRNAHGAGARAPRFAGRVLTSFERKGLAAGRSVTDLEYVRV